jgi:hypothetical protein
LLDLQYSSKRRNILPPIVTTDGVADVVGVEVDCGTALETEEEAALEPESSTVPTPVS